MMTITKLLALALVAAIVSGKNVPQTRQTFIGRSVLDEVPLIDGHNDFPYNLYGREQNMLGNFSFDSNLRENSKWANVRSSHTDLPRLRTGKVGGQFWVAYVSCSANYKDAVELTLDQIDVIKRLVTMYPNDLKLVTTADGITAAFNEKKLASMICVEGGHSIDSRMSVLRLYYELGVRYMTLTHNCNLPWADQNQMDQPNNINAIKVGGLTEWGKSLVLEMNRLGMMVDLSHVSKDVMMHALDVSQAPVIFSHSSAYGAYAHTRNVQDDVLRRVALNGGIVMVNFYNGFIAGATANMMDVIRHLEYIRSLIGVDYIGLGADYDGVSDTPVGLEDVSKYPDLFDALAIRGWTSDELKKLAGLNLIRVFKEVEAVRDRLVNTLPYDTPISYEDLKATNETFECRTNFRSAGSSMKAATGFVGFITMSVMFFYRMLH